MLDLCELQSLVQTFRHDNVVALHEVLLHRSTVFFVMEYLDGGCLCDAIRSKVRTKSSFSEAWIRSMTRQVLSAVAHMHSRSFIHRDLKPENILLSSPSSSDGGGNFKCKVADFSLARRILDRTRNPEDNHLTEYISTRWYRPPEVLHRKAGYGYPMDLYAVGCVVGEAYQLSPLFPGTDEIDQLARIDAATPVDDRRLFELVPRASDDGRNLMEKLLRYDPGDRWTARQALGHPFCLLRQDGHEATPAPVSGGGAGTVGTTPAAKRTPPPPPDAHWPNRRRKVSVEADTSTKVSDAPPNSSNFATPTSVLDAPAAPTSSSRRQSSRRAVTASAATSADVLASPTPPSTEASPFVGAGTGGIGATPTAMPAVGKGRNDDNRQKGYREFTGTDLVQNPYSNNSKKGELVSPQSSSSKM